MKRILCKIFFIGIFISYLNANEKIDINFKDLKIMDFINITSKIINKNILIAEEIEGNINFVSHKPLHKSELVDILSYILENKGYKIISNGDIFRIIKIEKINKEKVDIFNENIQTKQELKIFFLKNLEAINVLKIVEGVINKNIDTNSSIKPLISLDEDSNAIIVKATNQELNDIKILLDELDKERVQVYVHARIIEVNDELIDKIGISYGVFTGSVGSNGLTTFSSNLNGGSDSLGIVPNILDLNIPDIKSGLALGATLNLLKQNGALDIVSEPSILAINNKESSIYVGEKISIKTSSSETISGNERVNFQREDVGLTLKVKPRISSEEKVILEINTILEAIKTTQTKSGNADTLKKEIKTTAILNNGESVIIGGLIENKIETLNQKVPIVGNIPYLGELFNNETLNKKKNNLVIIVTPYVIPKTKDITFVRNKLAELKNLEDKYLEDSLVKLKEKSLKNKIEDKNRLKKVKKLDEELSSLENDSKQQEHEKRVSEILGY